MTAVAGGQDLPGVKVADVANKPVVEVGVKLFRRAGAIKRGDDRDFARSKRVTDALPPSLLRPVLRTIALTEALGLDLPGLGLPRSPFGSAMVTSMGINVLSIDDAVHALRIAAGSSSQGVFNIPGADTLPLTSLIARSGRRDLPVPGPLLAPLYDLRAWMVGFEFRYDQNLRRFHFGGVVDGARARAELGYRPTTRCVGKVR